MLVIVEKDRVYMAYSASFANRLADMYLTLDDMFSESNSFIWRVKPIKNCIMAGTSSMRYNDLIKYDNRIFRCHKADYASIVTQIMPNIDNKLSENNGFEENGDTKNLYYLAQGNRAYIINNKQCMEIEDTNVAGCYSGFIKEGLIKYKKLPVYERIYNSVVDVERYACESIFPMIVKDTMSSETKVIYNDGSVKTLYL